MTQGPGVANLYIYQGDDWGASVNVFNADGTPAQLDGYTAQAQIRTGTADQTWRVSAEIFCLVDGVLGQISLTLTNVQTTLLTEPSYYWDLQITAADGEITTLLSGQVQVAPEITRELPPPVVALVRVYDPYKGLFI